MEVENNHSKTMDSVNWLYHYMAVRHPSLLSSPSPSLPPHMFGSQDSAASLIATCGWPGFRLLWSLAYFHPKLNCSSTEYLTSRINTGWLCWMQSNMVWMWSESVYSFHLIYSGTTLSNTGRFYTGQASHQFAVFLRLGPRLRQEAVNTFLHLHFYVNPSRRCASNCVRWAEVLMMCTVVRPTASSFKTRKQLITAVSP